MVKILTGDAAKRAADAMRAEIQSKRNIRESFKKLIKRKEQLTNKKSTNKIYVGGGGGVGQSYSKQKTPDYKENVEAHEKAISDIIIKEKQQISRAKMQNIPEGHHGYQNPTTQHVLTIGGYGGGDLIMDKVVDQSGREIGRVETLRKKKAEVTVEYFVDRIIVRRDGKMVDIQKPDSGFVFDIPNELEGFKRMKRDPNTRRKVSKFKGYEYEYSDPRFIESNISRPGQWKVDIEKKNIAIKEQLQEPGFDTKGAITALHRLRVEKKLSEHFKNQFGSVESKNMNLLGEFQKSKIQEVDKLKMRYVNFDRTVEGKYGGKVLQPYTFEEKVKKTQEVGGLGFTGMFIYSQVVSGVKKIPEYTKSTIALPAMLAMDPFGTAKSVAKGTIEDFTYEPISTTVAFVIPAKLTPIISKKFSNIYNRLNMKKKTSIKDIPGVEVINRGGKKYKLHPDIISDPTGLRYKYGKKISKYKTDINRFTFKINKKLTSDIKIKRGGVSDIPGVTVIKRSRGGYTPLARHFPKKSRFKLLSKSGHGRIKITPKITAGLDMLDLATPNILNNKIRFKSLSLRYGNNLRLKMFRKSLQTRTYFNPKLRSNLMITKDVTRGLLMLDDVVSPRKYTLAIKHPKTGFKHLRHTTPLRQSIKITPKITAGLKELGNYGVNYNLMKDLKQPSFQLLKYRIKPKIKITPKITSGLKGLDLFDNYNLMKDLKQPKFSLLSSKPKLKYDVKITPSVSSGLKLLDFIDDASVKYSKRVKYNKGNMFKQSKQFKFLDYKKISNTFDSSKVTNVGGSQLLLKKPKLKTKTAVSISKGFDLLEMQSKPKITSGVLSMKTKKIPKRSLSLIDDSFIKQKKTTQKLFTKRDMSLRFLFKQESAKIIFPLFRQDTKQTMKHLFQVTEKKQDSFNMQKQFQNQDVFQKQISIPSQDQINIPFQIQTPITEIKLDNPFIIDEKLNKQHKIFGSGVPFSKDPKRMGRVPGFNVHMYEGGKRVKANKKLLPYNEAVRLGMDIADNSLSASFKVTRSNRKVPRGARSNMITGGFMNPNKFRPARSKKRRGFWVEKRGSRLDTVGETRGITAAKLVKQRRKQSFIGMEIKPLMFGKPKRKKKRKIKRRRRKK